MVINKSQNISMDIGKKKKEKENKKKKVEGGVKGKTQLKDYIEKEIIKLLFGIFEVCSSGNWN